MADKRPSGRGEGAEVGVLIVDDSDQVRESISKMLEASPKIRVAGTAGDGETAVQEARRLCPDVILMDINMPKKDGITATAEILAEMETQVVMVSVEGDPDYFRRAMQVGARDFLVKPFTCNDLTAAVLNAFRKGNGCETVQNRVVSLFATKGGVGRSMLAANLASALAVRRGCRVALCDFDLEFGNQAALLGANPYASVVDLCRADGPLTPQVLEQCLQETSAGTHLLVAAPAPDLAAEVVGEARRQPGRNYISDILSLAAAEFPYVVVDTAVGFSEANLTVLDMSDLILLVTGPDILSLQNTGKALDILLNQLEYPASKVQLVLNRADSAMSLSVEDISRGLDYEITHLVPSDGKTVVWAVNYGKPFVLNRRESPVARAVNRIADAVAGETESEAEVEGGKRSFLGLLAGR